MASMDWLDDSGSSAASTSSSDGSSDGSSGSNEGSVESLIGYADGNGSRSMFGRRESRSDGSGRSGSDSSGFSHSDSEREASATGGAPGAAAITAGSDAAGSPAGPRSGGGGGGGGGGGRSDTSGSVALDGGVGVSLPSGDDSSSHGSSTDPGSRTSRDAAASGGPLVRPEQQLGGASTPSSPSPGHSVPAAGSGIEQQGGSGKSVQQQLLDLVRERDEGGDFQ